MSENVKLSDIDGWSSVYSIIGDDFSFHDAEIESINLSTAINLSWIEFSIAPSGETGRDFSLRKFRVLFFGIDNVELIGWDNRNIVYEVNVTKVGKYFIFDMQGSVGVSGEIRAELLRFDL